MKNPWKTTWAGTHLECSAEFWSLYLLWVLTFVRNKHAERFHFLMFDSSSPLQVEPQELWNASSWRCIRVKLKLEKKVNFLFSVVPKTFCLLLFRLVVMKVTRWMRPRLLWTPRQDFPYTSQHLAWDPLLDLLCVTSGNLRGWRSQMGHGRGQIPHGSLCEEPETPPSRYLLHAQAVKMGTFKGTPSLSSPPSSFSVWWISKNLRKRDWGQHQEGDVRLSGGRLSGRRCVSAPP